MESDSLGGGELAGLIRFRDEDLAAASGRLGQLAAAVGAAYNAQQALGRDATGAVGAPMFDIGDPRAFGSTLEHRQCGAGRNLDRWHAGEQRRLRDQLRRHQLVGNPVQR
jgi:flagellar hook-associated protein 1 FlgK